MKWRTEKRLYRFIEISKKSYEEYHLVMTGEEVANYCKNKMVMNGYVEGVGGDRSYAIVANEVTY